MILLNASILAAALLAAPTQGPDISELAVPVEWASSMGSRLVRGADGHTYLSWLEESQERARLRYSVLGSEGWRAPRTIAEGSGWMLNWADYSVLAVAPDGSMAATWLARTGAEGSWDYGVRIAVSNDGETWSQGTSLHGSAAGPEHGFVSLVPTAPSSAEEPPSFDAVWLDSRAMAPSAGNEEHGPGAMALYYRSVSAADGEAVLGPEVLLDERTCDCCATSALSDGRGGLFVAYRDRSGKEVRDISVLHRTAAGETTHMDPRADHWTVAGCPVNGPSLADQGERMAMAWFTADRGLTGTATPKPMVKAAFGTMEAGFDTPTRVDLGAPIGRAMTAWNGEGHLLVAWLEGGSGGTKAKPALARWMLQDMGTGDQSSGAMSDPIELAEVPATRMSGFASVVWVGEEDALLFAFTNVDADGKARVETRVVK